ncbi:MAG: hypothetical protein LBQ43_02795 [Holosporales bacterium]|jgi:hypothetical protein|nr:hypothetical protein [Holosporales bacterium]
MRVKNNSCAVTTVVTEAEKRLFIAMAHSLDVPYTVLMRRLIRYFLDEKISWSDLFRQYNELSLTDTPENPVNRHIRTHVGVEQYTAFVQHTEEWGSTPTAIARRLILLYITGKIERGAIWY